MFESKKKHIFLLFCCYYENVFILVKHEQFTVHYLSYIILLRLLFPIADNLSYKPLDKNLYTRMVFKGFCFCSIRFSYCIKFKEFIPSRYVYKVILSFLLVWFAYYYVTIGKIKIIGLDIWMTMLRNVFVFIVYIDWGDYVTLIPSSFI